MDNYPPGARNDPNAPYNRHEPEPVPVKVYVSFTLGKHTDINTNEWHNEYDDDKMPVKVFECDFNREFKYQRLNPMEIIQRVAAYVEEYRSVLEIERERGVDNRDKLNNIRYLLDEMMGWEEEDSCVVED